MTNRILSEDLSHIYDGFAERDCFKGSSVLITGCSGFLGFGLMQFFAAYSDSLKITSVIGLDNFRLSRPKWVDDLEARHAGRVHLHDFDVVNDDLDRIDGARNAGFILHLASIASPTFYRKYPLETLDANVWGLRKLLDYYRGKKIKNLVFFSSSEVYGDPSADAIPTAEDYRGLVATLGPRACYCESKRFCETLCYVHSTQFGLPIVIVRPFNNYGPGMRLGDKRAPADFAKAVFEGQDVVLHSDGSPTRTFCYIADATLGYLKACAHGRFDSFNIGIGQPEISMKQLADIFVAAGRTVMDYKGEARIEPSSEAAYLTHNPARRCPNIEKAKRLLAYAPRIGVEEGVSRFLEFIKLNAGIL